jgi:glycosyltransferase involved in cell wall biosynthesis
VLTNSSAIVPSSSGPAKVSATVITFNEEHDLAACLSSLSWCDEIVVVDSGSTDRTAEVAVRHGARVFVVPFQGFSEQKNFAAEQTTSEWILSIDADENVSAELQEEIRLLPLAGTVSGYFIPRKNLWLSHPIRHGGWSPDYTLRLYRKGDGEWRGLSHEQVVVNGDTGVLRNPIVHDTIASVHDHLRKGLISSVLELKESRNNNFHLYWFPPWQTVRRCAKDLWTGPKSLLGLRLIYKRHIKNTIDLVWLLPWYPFLRFFYMYILRVGFLDGAPGFWLAYTSAIVEAMKCMKIWEHYIHHAERSILQERTLENPTTLYRSIS